MRPHKSAQNSRKAGPLCFNNSQKKSKWQIYKNIIIVKKIPIKTAVRISAFQISEVKCSMSYANRQGLGKWEFSYYVGQSIN